MMDWVKWMVYILEYIFAKIWVAWKAYYKQLKLTGKKQGGRVWVGKIRKFKLHLRLSLVAVYEEQIVYVVRYIFAKF